MKLQKAFQEVGYPQGITQGQYAKTSYYDNELEHYIDEGTYTENFIILGIDAPTYLEVWLWLWQEKNIFIQTIKHVNGFVSVIFLSNDKTQTVKDMFHDPEEAIIASVRYLVDNNLIK